MVESLLRSEWCRIHKYLLVINDTKNFFITLQTQQLSYNITIHYDITRVTLSVTKLIDFPSHIKDDIVKKKKKKRFDTWEAMV